MNTMLEQRRKKRAHNPLDDLPENCIFDILVRLPIETLCSSRFVCKSWYEIISSPDFRNAQLHRSGSTTAARGLIFLTLVKNFMVYIKSMEFIDGKRTIKDYNTAFNGKITAACNGLIVLERNPKTAGLILHNPVTREDEDIPPGNNSSSPLESYGLAFCHVSRRYKLLHLFTKLGDELRKFGCEIMDIGSGSWRAVGVPPTKDYYLLQNPIFSMGALHWVQYVDDDECMVSMSLDDEKFKTMAIPDTAGGDYFHFKSVFAMGEFLGFSGVLERCNHQIGVWILRGLGGEYGWEKQFNIDIVSGLGNHMTTLLCYGGGVNGYSFVFKCGDGCLYAYDDDDGQMMRKIEGFDDVADTSIWRIFPHVNSLVTWRSLA